MFLSDILGACMCLAFNSKKNEHGGHGNAPCGAEVFKKISDDAQKIYSRKLNFKRRDTKTRRYKDNFRTRKTRNKRIIVLHVFSSNSEFIEFNE